VRASRDFPKSKNDTANRRAALARLNDMPKTTIRFAQLRFDVPRESSWLVGDRCFWCGTLVKNGQPGVVRGTDKTREHIVPKCYGGRGTSNLVVACRRCNNARGNDVFWQPHPTVASSYALRALAKLREEARKVFAEAGKNA